VDAESTDTQDTDAQLFLTAGAEGRYLIKFCPRCELSLESALIACKSRGGTDLESTESAGRAAVVACTRVHRSFDPAPAGEVPFVLGVARLAEGPLIVGRVAGNSALPAGQQVRVEFRPSGGSVLPVFIEAEPALA
jgi:uncharacterized OB-fold protein